MLPAAERLYKQYGGVFRNRYIELDELGYNDEIIMFFYADLWENRYPNEMENLFETAREDFDILREFVGQEVCPLGDIGYYYPPIVYVGENGLLYCVYEYMDEIEIYDTHEEIMAIQLSEKVAQSPMDEW